MTQKHIRRRKIAYLFRLQHGQCAITGQDLDKRQVLNRWYAQLHHAIIQSDINERLYPHYVHCVWNLHLVKAGPHGTFPTPPGIPHRIALLVDKHLAANPELDALVNMQTDAEIHVEELAKLFDELLTEVWPERWTA